MPDPSGQKTLQETVSAAVDDVARHGYDSEERVAYWEDQIRRAAQRGLRGEAEVDAAVREAMSAVFRRQVDGGGLLRRHPGVSAYTLQQLRPQLHAELSRRVAANLGLIKLNREEAVRKATHRFRGWATSVPAGGSDTVERREQQQEIRKSLSQLGFADRRVIIDQTAKLNASISATVALNGDAIGAVWHSHKYQAGYDGRPEHDARDGVFYLVRDSWAQRSGLVKAKDGRYTDSVEQPAMLPFCRCHWEWTYSIRSVPDDFMTDRGREALRQARERVRSLA
jgi:hypothetical protein